MQKTEAAMILAGVTPEEQRQASAPTNLHVITGTVTGKSDSGKTQVSVDGLVFTADNSQYIEIDTLGGLEEGDVATILLTGENGRGMTPLAVGAPGSIDRIDVRIKSIEADYVKATLLEAEVAKLGYLSADSAVIKNLEAGKAYIDDLTAKDITVERLEANTAYIKNLELEGITTDKITATTGYIDDLTTKNITADKIEAASGYIDDLTAKNITTGNIEAASGYIANLTAKSITADDIEATSGYIADLTAANITASDISADHATVGELDTTYATIGSLNAEQARVNNLLAGKASVADLTAANGRIDTLQSTKADISVLESDYITANAIDATYLHADMSNADVAWIQNGTIKDGSISNAMINSLSANKLTAGTINGETINVTNINADNITAGTINGQRIGEGSLSLDKLSEDVYTEQEVDNKLATMQAEIDGAIETWTGTAVPTLNNSPASDWTTAAVRDTHVGDVYFVVNSQSEQNGYNYRFTKSGNTYSWQLIKDSDVTNALQRISTAEGKITTFDSDISTLKTDTGTLKTKTTSLETRMSDAEDDILDKVDTTTFNEVSDTVDQHSRTITQMSETISNKADGSTVTSLTQRVSKNEQDISGINTTIGELSTTVESKADGSTVESVSNRLNTVSDTVDGHTQSISSITSTQTTMQGKLDKTIVESTQLWYTKADTTAPSKPTSQVTSTSTSGGAWRTVVPAYSSSYPNYFYCYQWKYSDGTYGWSNVTRDIAMGESQSTSRTAASDASTAKATADKNIKSSTQLWYTKADETAPSKPTSKVTSTSVSGNAWRTVVPTYSSSYPNYFYCYQYELADGTYTWSDVVYDRATTENQSNSRSAVSGVSTLTSKTNTISNTVEGHTSQLNSITETQTTIQGSAVKSTVQLWFTKANTTAPAKPTAHVTTNNASTANAWNLAVPTYNSSYPYYYYCYEHQLLNDTYTWSAVTRDIATEESQSTSRSAKATADKNIKESQQLWYTKANSTAPAKPTSKVTSTATTGGAWTTRVPTYSDDYKHYFYCMQYVAADGTVTWSDVVYDQATTEAQSVARAASADLTEFHQEYATFKQTTQKFESTVGETYATKGELETTDGKVTSLTTRVSTAETNITQNTNNITIKAKKMETIDGNMLYDVDAPNLTKIFGPANRYFSDSGNASFMVCDIREVTDSPATGIEYMAHWSVSGSSANKQRGLCFYNGNYVQLVTGQKYILSCWVRCTSGKFTYCNNAYATSFPTSSGARTIDSSVDSSWQFVTTTVTATKTQLDRVYFMAKTLSDSLAFECDMCGFKMVPAAYATQAELKVANDEIDARVEKNGVISAINLSDETAKIQASKVEIDGTAVFKAANTIPDTRNNNQPPSWYFTNYPRQSVTEFKTSSVMGLTGETYCYVTTVTGWNDASGGYPKQTAQIAGKTYWRVGTSASAWGAWQETESTTGAQNKANEAVNNLEIGGRNLLPLSGYIVISQGPDIISDDGYIHDSSSSGDGRAWSYANSQWKIHLDAGTYTLSWTVSTATSSSAADMQIWNSSNSQIKAFGNVFNTVGTSSAQFTLSAATDIGLMFKLYTAVVRFKLERGSKATDWTPAPEDIQANIDAIQVGGRNLFSRSQTLESPVWVPDNGSAGGVTVANGIATLPASTGARIYQLPANGYWAWAANTEYVVSIDAKASAAGGILRFNMVGAGASKINSVNISTSWQRYSWAFTSDATVSTGSASFYNGSTSGTIQLRLPKLENGNKSTEWSPAPEDLQANAISRTQRIYYRALNPMTSWTMPTAWLTTTGDVFGQWTCKVPRMTVNADGTGTKYLYLYTCEQREMGDGSLAYTTVLLDDSTTVIDGGTIITGSVTANKLNATNINASKLLTVGAMTNDAASSILNSNVIIGGENLLQGTTNPQVGSDSTPPYWIIGSGGNGSGSIATVSDSPVAGTNKSFRISGNTSGNRDWQQRVADLHNDWTGSAWSGGQWVFSAYVRAIGSSCTAMVRAWSSEQNFIKTWTAGTSWERVEIPVKLSGGHTITYVNFLMGLAGAGSIEYIAPKLERGNKATDWSPAPVDVSTSIDSVYEKIRSQGLQLVINGNGFMGDNTNWPGLRFDGSKANGSPGSFTKSVGYTTIFTEEAFPIDPSKQYLFEFDAMSDGGTGHLYSFLATLDTDKNLIDAFHIMYYPNTLTTLASDLNPGDTTVKLASAANFATTSATHQRTLIFWDYKNSSGYTYPAETYSRNFYSDLYADDSKVNKSTGVITLKSAWTGPKKTAGTQVSQGHSGSTYNYSHINIVIPATWTHYSALISGINTSKNGSDAAEKFRQGSAFAKVGFLWNYNNSNQGQIWVTNVSVKEATVNQASLTEVKNNAVKRTQRIYYRKSASGAPATPGTASSNWVVKDSDGSNVWTKMHIAISSTEKFIYTCEQYEMGDGTVGYTSVLLDNTITVIDGGKIITGSVSANAVNAASGTFAEANIPNLSASKITTGTIAIGRIPDAAKNENVVVGGRNFLLDTASMSGWTGTNGTTISEGIATFPTATANTWRELYPSKNFRYSQIRNQTVVFSAKVMATSGSACSLNLCIGVDTDETAFARKKYRNQQINFTGTGSWVTVSAVANITDSWFNSGSGTVDFDNCWVTVRPGAWNTYWPGFQLKELKLELGNKATDWSPAPEDVTNDINAVADATADTFDSINTSISGVSNSLKETDERLANLTQAVTDSNEERAKWIRADSTGLTIGETGSNYNLYLDNDSVDFKLGTETVATASIEAFVPTALRLGDYVLSGSSDGYLYIDYQPQ